MNDVIILASSNVSLTDFTESISSSIKLMQYAAQGEQNKCFLFFINKWPAALKLASLSVTTCTIFSSLTLSTTSSISENNNQQSSRFSSINRSMVDHASIKINHEINNRLYILRTPAITHDCATILLLFCFYWSNIYFNFFHFLL